MSKKHVFIRDIDCGADPLFLIAGPCVIEAEPLMMRTAERLKKIAANLEVGLIFKSSFSKDNRSSLEFYQGRASRRA
jgi:2-dehydro-3-deoxyphosphooctonate aldolase (KDO 8-P synthase)